MPLLPASQFSILKSLEKDTQCVNILRQSVDEVCKRWLGTQRWLKWKDEVETCSCFLYYFLTTVQGVCFLDMHTFMLLMLLGFWPIGKTKHICCGEVP